MMCADVLPRRALNARRHHIAFALMMCAFALILLATDIITPAGRRWAAAHGLPLLSAMFVLAALVRIRSRYRTMDRRRSARGSDGKRDDASPSPGGAFRLESPGFQQ